MVEEGIKVENGSEYNEAALQIVRINYLKQQRSEAMIKGQFEKAHWINNEIFDQLSSDAQKLDKGLPTEKKYFTKAELIEQQLNKVRKERNKFKSYYLLRRYTQLLEELQDNAGKGGKYRDPEMDSMTR